MLSTPIHPVRRVALLFALLLCAATAQAATIKAWGRGVQLQPLRAFDAALGWYQVLLTTSDGIASNVPRYYTSNGFIYVSGELWQSSTTDYFETEYLVYQESSGLFVEYGAFSVFLPISDANANGFPDWMERDQPASISVNGVQFVDYPVSTSRIAPVTFSRSAGSANGTYTFRGASGTTLSGTWTVGYADGPFTYNRAVGTVAFSLIGPNGTRSATAAFTLAGPNQMSLPAFTLTMPSKPSTATSGTTTLARSGTTYRGAATLTDGLTDTPWADFQPYVVEVTDTSDADGDGVPDLSDALLSAPAIVRQSVPRFDFPVTPGYTYRLRGSTDLKTWTDYATHTASGSVWQYTPPAGSRTFLKIVSP